MAAEYDATRARMAQLVKTLTAWNRAYYDDDNPEVSDQVYDQALAELEALEREHPTWISPESPTRHVGGTSAKRFRTVPHTVPMLSLSDRFTVDDVLAFMHQWPGEAFVGEAKIDGLSLAVRYEHGRLVRALTRGDGLVGEDVTANARVVDGIPHTLDVDWPCLEVRGEVYLPRARFQALNEAREEAGEARFANARNAAAGTLRQLDVATVAARGLSFLVFNVQVVEGIHWTSHSESLRALSEHGFSISPRLTALSDDTSVRTFLAELDRDRATLPCDIDGAVIKIDDLKRREALGATAKTPRWAVAYKYPAARATTRLRTIDVSVGRTGRLTPVAIFDPVALAGTQVSRASLHNQNYIDLLDVRIGDTIEVSKAGDIIPEVVAVDTTKRPADTTPYHLPTQCPVCGDAVVREPETADALCPNPACPAQRERRLVWFASQDAMDIQGLGPEAVRRLIGWNLLTSLADLYTLTSPSSRAALALHGEAMRQGHNLARAGRRLASAPIEPLFATAPLAPFRARVSADERKALATRCPDVAHVMHALEAPVCPSLECDALEALADAVSVGGDASLVRVDNDVQHRAQDLKTFVSALDAPASQILTVDWIAHLVTTFDLGSLFDLVRLLTDEARLEAWLVQDRREHIVTTLSRLANTTDVSDDREGSAEQTDNLVALSRQRIKAVSPEIPWSLSQVRALVATGLVTQPDDLGHLIDCVDEVITAVYATKSQNELIAAIEASKTRPLERLITALGVPGVGATTALAIARAKPSIDLLTAATYEDWLAIDGVGETTAAALFSFFQDPSVVALLHQLKDAGLAPTVSETPMTSRPLDGQSIVLTGTLPTLTRAEAKARIVALGGRVQSAVSVKTDVVVAGEAAGQKLDKARALGVTVVDEAWLIAMGRK